MKCFRPILAVALVLGACQHKPSVTATSTPAPEPYKPKGEFAFLLDYEGQLPSEVGFLTNHVVERRLANIMKDSFVVFLNKAQYDRPLIIMPEGHTIEAVFYKDADRTRVSAEVTIGVDSDAVWALYFNGDSSVEFADHPSIKNPVE